MIIKCFFAINLNRIYPVIVHDGFTFIWPVDWTFFTRFKLPPRPLIWLYIIIYNPDIIISIFTPVHMSKTKDMEPFMQECSPKTLFLPIFTWLWIHFDYTWEIQSRPTTSTTSVTEFHCDNIMTRTICFIKLQTPKNLLLSQAWNSWQHTWKKYFMYQHYSGHVWNENCHMLTRLNLSFDGGLGLNRRRFFYLFIY